MARGRRSAGHQRDRVVLSVFARIAGVGVVLFSKVGLTAANSP